MIDAARTNLVRPLSLIFCNDADRDVKFLVDRIANWTGNYLTPRLRFAPQESQFLCYETRFFCMQLQIEQLPLDTCDLIYCNLGLNDGSEDFSSYQPITLFLLFQVLNKRLNISKAQIKKGDTLIADYYTENNNVYDRLKPDYPISNPQHLVDLVSRIPEIQQ